MSSKSFRKHVFSKFSGTNLVRRTSEVNTERVTVFGDEMRCVRDMVLLIQHSMEHVETRHMKRTYTCHNPRMSRSGEVSLSQQMSLYYLDLAVYRRKPIDDELIEVPENNPSAPNLSKSCVILNHIDL